MGAWALVLSLKGGGVHLDCDYESVHTCVSFLGIFLLDRGKKREGGWERGETGVEKLGGTRRKGGKEHFILREGGRDLQDGKQRLRGQRGAAFQGEPWWPMPWLAK
jgi:hypothetical protein